jgi:hypothetical protein
MPHRTCIPTCINASQFQLMLHSRSGHAYMPIYANRFMLAILISCPRSCILCAYIYFLKGNMFWRKVNFDLLLHPLLTSNISVFSGDFPKPLKVGPKRAFSHRKWVGSESYVKQLADYSAKDSLICRLGILPTLGVSFRQTRVSSVFHRETKHIANQTNIVRGVIWWPGAIPIHGWYCPFFRSIG